MSGPVVTKKSMMAKLVRAADALLNTKTKGGMINLAADDKVVMNLIDAVELWKRDGELRKVSK